MAIPAPHDKAAVWRRIDALLERIPHDGNRDLVRRYANDRLIVPVKPATAFNDVNALMAFCRFIEDKCLDTQVERPDIVAYLNQAHQLRIWRNVKKDGTSTITERKVPLGPGTLWNRKQIIRSFYKWLRDTDEYPPEVRRLGGRGRVNGSVVAERLIGRDELRAMIQAHMDHRSKALLAVLAESGLRAGEFCALNIGSVEFVKQWAFVTIPPDAPGLKTGARRILIIDSVPYLHAWLEAHPRKDDPAAPLFFTMSRRCPGARLTSNGLYKFCTDASKNAGLKIHTNPHLFRHSAATEKARLGWNEAMLRAYFGWTPNSDMPSRYVHLAARDYEQMELSRRGLLDDEDKPRPALERLKCAACSADNAITASWCEQCRHPVSPGAAIDLRKRQMEAMSAEMAGLVRESVNQALAERGLAQR